MNDDRDDQRRTRKPSMNEANERDPFNNNCYGTLVDQRLQAGQPAGPRRGRFQRAHHPRLRGRLRREGPAGRPVAGPLAGPRRHRHPARLQQHRPGNPRVHPRELHRLHGLRHRVPRHRHPRQGPVRDGVGSRSSRRSPRPTGRCTARSGPRPRSTTTPARRSSAPAACSRSSSTPPSARAAPSASPSATTTP